MASFLSKIKSFVAPSPQEGAARRQAVFGSTSKTGAAAKIIGAAAAAIAAPVIVTAPVVRAAASKVASSVGAGLVSGIGQAAAKAAASPLKSAAIGLGTTAVIAGGGLQLIPHAYSATKKSTEVVVSLVENEIPFTPDNFKDIGRTGGALVGAGLIGAGIGVGAEKLYSSMFDKQPTNDIPLPVVSDKDNKQPDKSLSAPPVMAASSVPLSRETQIVPSGSSSSRIAKRSKFVPSIQKQSVKINIINNSRLGERYIKSWSHNNA